MNRMKHKTAATSIGIASDEDAVRKFIAAPQAAVSCSLRAANRREQLLLRQRFKHALINHFRNQVCSPREKRGGGGTVLGIKSTP